MLKHLKKVYGYKSFRDCQEDVINDILEKKDTIVILPTGGGKSLCYQFPATYLNKKSVVISPLISLMTDQQLHLTVKGITSICLNNETSYPINLKDKTIIYTTPEFFTKNLEMFIDIEDTICLFAVDESHCLSEWGHDFRVSYRKLDIIKKNFKDIPIVALTATATPNVLTDIFNVLNLEEASQYQLSTVRDNLSIYVKEKSDNILKDLNIDPNVSTIVYTQTKKMAEKIYKLLLSINIKAGLYHSGLTKENKLDTHTRFVKDDIKCVVATVCFGMGIDKPDIRKIINYGSPCNIETYYQEIGRAGRDGMPSTVILLFNNSDYKTNSFLFNKSPLTLVHKTKLLNIFQKFIINKITCRQELMEHYFTTGDLLGKIPNVNKCGKCDNCIGLEYVTETINVINEYNIITNLIESLPINYGIVKIIDIIMGTNKKFIYNNYYNSNINLLEKPKSVEWWKKLIFILIQNGYLVQKSIKFYSILCVGLLQPEEDLLINMSVDINCNRESKYKKIRNDLSKKYNIPSYMILNDKVLALIEFKKPKTLQELININGINNNFICKYGNYFI